MCPNSHSHRLGLKPARTIYLGIAGCATLLLEMMSTVEGVYKVTTVGLNPLQLVLLGTSLEVAVFLFEVPTGVVADLYSRRLSVIIGLGVMGAASVLIGSILLLLIMTEHGFKPVRVAEHTTLQRMGHTFRAGMAVIRGRPVLIMILVIVGLFGMTSETFDRLWEIHLLKDFTFPLAGRLQPVVWFGIINVGSMVLTMVVAEVVRRQLDITNPSAIAGMLATMTAIRLAALLVFGLTHGFAIAVTAYWTARALVGLSQPMIVAWLNRGLDPAVRATVLSMRGQVDAIGQIAGGAAFGLLATAVSVRAAFTTVAGILAPAVALLKKAGR